MVVNVGVNILENFTSYINGLEDIPSIKALLKDLEQKGYWKYNIIIDTDKKIRCHLKAPDGRTTVEEILLLNNSASKGLSLFKQFGGQQIVAKNIKEAFRISLYTTLSFLEKKPIKLISYKEYHEALEKQKG